MEFGIHASLKHWSERLRVRIPSALPTGNIRMTSLFPKPYCSTCFEELHEGHYGWDLCSRCAHLEKLICERDKISWPPDWYNTLDSGKPWYDCPCYSAAVVKWQTRMP